MHKIVFLPCAVKDIEETVDYLSQFYESTAVKKYDKIMSSIELLKYDPFLGTEFYRLNGYHYRKLVCEEYLIFYVIQDQIVEIHSIVNGRTDYLHKLI